MRTEPGKKDVRGRLVVICQDVPSCPSKWPVGPACLVEKRGEWPPTASDGADLPKHCVRGVYFSAVEAERDGNGRPEGRLLPDLVADLRRAKRQSREGRQALPKAAPKCDLDGRETGAIMRTSPEAAAANQARRFGAQVSLVQRDCRLCQQVAAGCSPFHLPDRLRRWLLLQPHTGRAHALASTDTRSLRLGSGSPRRAS